MLPFHVSFVLNLVLPTYPLLWASSSASVSVLLCFAADGRFLPPSGWALIHSPYFWSTPLCRSPSVTQSIILWPIIPQLKQNSSNLSYINGKHPSQRLRYVQFYSDMHHRSLQIHSLHQTDNLSPTLCTIFSMHYKVYIMNLYPKTKRVEIHRSNLSKPCWFNQRNQMLVECPGTTSKYPLAIIRTAKMKNKDIWTLCRSIRILCVIL